MKIFFLKFEIVFESHHPIRHIKYKSINLAPCNKSLMKDVFFSTNLEQFLRRIQSPLMQ